MATVVNMREARAHLSKLVDRVRLGEEIVIARDGRPVARLVPVEAPKMDRQPGSARGRIWIADDFDAPLPDDILNSFEV